MGLTRLMGPQFIMIQKSACSAIVKGLASSLRKTYKNLRIEGHPSVVPQDSVLAPLAVAILNIKDITNTYGVCIKITETRFCDTTLFVYQQPFIDGNARKWAKWSTVDLLHPNSIDNLESQIRMAIDDLLSKHKGESVEHVATNEV